jgi:hypothetical protein
MDKGDNLAAYLEKCGDASAEYIWTMYQHPGNIWREFFTEDQFKLMLTVVDQYVRQMLINYDTRNM